MPPVPVPTALAATTRYIPAGVRRYVWIPTVAAKNAPVLAEISAGTDLTGEIPPDGVSGFTVTADDVDAGDYISRFKKKIPGMTDSADSSIKLYVSSTSVDARQLLVDGLNGFIGVWPEGISATSKYSLFPVRIKSSDIEQVAAADAAVQMVQFSITDTPAKNLTTPAA